jgi:Domain of unknown function (DUF4357)
MSSALTIRVFLVKGDPDGLRTAEVSSWTGKAVAGPRSDLASLLARPELDGPGLYILAGENPESDQRAIYIGEAESVRKRLPNHSNKDYWSQACVFTVKDDTFTKAHVKYLEGRLIELARYANLSCVMNTKSSTSRLPEADEAEMEVYLERALQLLPILGIDEFKEGGRVEDSSPELICRIKGLVARGRRTSSGFIVYKGSQAVPKDRASAIQAAVRRRQLLESGVLRSSGGFLEFTRDYEFTSPSGAGSVIRGGSTNGLTSWRTADGVTLKELEVQS